MLTGWQATGQRSTWIIKFGSKVVVNARAINMLHIFLVKILTCNMSHDTQGGKLDLFALLSAVPVSTLQCCFHQQKAYMQKYYSIVL